MLQGCDGAGVGPAGKPQKKRGRPSPAASFTKALISEGADLGLCQLNSKLAR